AGDRRYSQDNKKKLPGSIRIYSGGLPAPHSPTRQDVDVPGGSALSFFLRGFFFSLSLEQRDLLDASRVGRAPGRHVRIVFERVVDESPLVRIHRLELKRPTGNTKEISQFSHALHDAILAHGPVMFANDHDLFGL